MVGGPAYDGFEDNTLIGERAVGVVAYGVAQQVTVACRVAEIVLAIILVHPRGLEESVRVASLQRLSVLVDNEHGTRSLGKLQEVIIHASHQAGQGWHIGSREELGLAVRSWTEVHTFLQHLLGGNIPLQLSSPQSAIVAVDLPIIVLEHTGVDAVSTTNGVLLRNERTLRTVSDGYSEVEHAVVILSREDEVVLAVFLNNIAIPHLLLCPRHILNVEDYSVVGDLAFHHVVHREHVIVFHLEMTAIVIEGCASLLVVTGIYIDASVKHVGCRISHIIARE